MRSRPSIRTIVRAVHHPTNLGYGAALRTGLGAAQYDLIAFTDGDRQFKVADLARLTERLAVPDARTWSSATASSAPTRSIRTIYARAVPPGESDAVFGLKRHATWTAPASCSGARRSTGSASNRAAPSSRPSC